MNHQEFEDKLTADFKCWFVHPLIYVPGTDKDATVLSPEEFILAYEKESAKLSKGVKRIAESVGTFTYYSNGERGFIKAKVPTGTGAAPLLDTFALKVTLGRAWNTLLFRLGIL